MAKAETEGHDHEVTTEKVKGKDQVILVKGCARCTEIKEARQALQDLIDYNTYRDQRQALYDKWWEADQAERKRPTAALAKKKEGYAQKMSALDKKLNKLQPAVVHNWKNLTYKP